MKRQRDIEGLESIDLANCLMLLSCPPQQQQSKRKSSFGQVEFECKTCNRKFSSFQALGGHRASHRRSKLLEGDIDGELKATSLRLGIINKPKVHECSICGQEFSLGQALGGHMRRHRALLINEEFSSSSIEKVMRLDLNLTPLENDLKLLFGKMAPPMLM